MNIGFIGAGNMGGAILKGFLAWEKDSTNNYFVCGSSREKSKETAKRLGITSCGSIKELVEICEIFFLGVKPGDFTEVLPQIKTVTEKGKICVSMAAGITIKAMERVLGSNAKIVRIMPNMPVMVGEGMVSVSRNVNVTDDECGIVIDLFNRIGRAVEVEEELIHAVIGVSGSSPAYTYMYIDSLIKAAEDNGISSSDARVFAAQAVLGAAKQVLESEIDLHILVDDVCSPEGATIEAVELLKREDFEKTVKKGAQAAIEKSILMSRR